MKRTLYSSGTKWEPIVGYSRAIRVGDVIEVSGTVSVDQKGIVFGKGDAYQQTKRIIEIITEAVEALGGTIGDIVRTRIYVSNMEDWERIGQAHGETFYDIRPVTTMVEVSNLISSEYLVEIEATAMIDPGREQV